MSDKRNASVDITRVAAAAGIILCHVDMTGYGAIGILVNQFLSVRFSLMFFLAIIGYYLEKSYQAGRNPIPGRILSLVRIYGIWSLVYVAMSFVMLVVIQDVPLKQFLISKAKGFFLSGSYYHFWFYPAVIYSLLVIGVMKRLSGNRAIQILMPAALALYAVGLFGTGYLPLGQMIPGLRTLYGAEVFKDMMHLCFLGFPSIVFGMAAAQKTRESSTHLLLAAAALYVAECMILCLHLGWREDPQMLLSTPLLTLVFLHWIEDRKLGKGRLDPSLLRIVSSSMYNVHPLLLAVFALILPGLDGLWAFALCTVCSVGVGWMLYRLRKFQFITLFI